MIKLSFKLFGCLTVALFFILSGLYIAIASLPPSYIVRDEIRENVYPSARENLKEKFNYFLKRTMNAEDVGEFKISEIEMNSFLYYWASDVFLPGGAPVITDPYLFVNDGFLKLRFDISFKNIMRLISSKFSGRDFKESINKITAEGDETGGRIAVTAVVKVFWLKKEDRPYLYFDRLYIGVLPLPFPVMLTDYQDQFNRMLESSFQKTFTQSPVYIRKIELANKQLKFKTELVVSDRVAMQKRMREFNRSNPELARAMDSKQCLYGCTEKERLELQKWMNKVDSHSANEVSKEEVLFFKLVQGKMNGRKAKLMRENRDGIEWRDWKKYKEMHPDQEWEFKNAPEPDIHKYE